MPVLVEEIAIDEDIPVGVVVSFVDVVNIPDDKILFDDGITVGVGVKVIPIP